MIFSFISLLVTQLSAFFLLSFTIIFGKAGFLAFYAEHPDRLWSTIGIYCGFALVWSLVQAVLHFPCGRMLTAIWIGLITGTIGFMFFASTFFLTCFSRTSCWIGFAIYCVVTFIVMLNFLTMLKLHPNILISGIFVLFYPLLLLLLWLLLFPQTADDCREIAGKLKEKKMFAAGQKYLLEIAEKNKEQKYIWGPVRKSMAYISSKTNISFKSSVPKKETPKAVAAVKKAPAPEKPKAAVVKKAPAPEKPKAAPPKAVAVKKAPAPEKPKAAVVKKAPAPAVPKAAPPKAVAAVKKAPAPEKTKAAAVKKASAVKPLLVTLEPDLQFNFAFIPADKLTAGAASAAAPGFKYPFAMGVYAVTQQQYEKVMNENPSAQVGKTLPVTQISWQRALEFCEKLNRKYASRLPEGYVFSLPTETQWEYACRAGTTAAPDLKKAAWFKENSGRSVHPVGGKEPNKWGLYDMLGNVFEWCYDGCREKGNVRESTIVLDPSRTGTPDGNPGICRGDAHIIRGGGYNDPPQNCRIETRFGFRKEAVFIGFRVALVRKESR